MKHRLAALLLALTLPLAATPAAAKPDAAPLCLSLEDRAEIADLMARREGVTSTAEASAEAEAVAE